MIYYLIDLAWALAVRRDTQGNQWNVQTCRTVCILWTSAHTKVVQTRHVLRILTSKCAFRHSRVHFVNISTYKSGPNTSCFEDFDFQMCLSPQPRAFFQHQHAQKWSKHVKFCAFWLPNVLFATAACNFSTSELPKVLSECGVLLHFHFQTCLSQQPCAIFRHLDLEKCSEDCCFLTFALANVLFATAACNFWFSRWPPDSAPAALTGLLFDWPDTRIIEKTQHFATSLTFGADVSSFTWLWHYCIFCRLTWLLDCWAMHLLFNSPYCRKFLFKLPSIRSVLYNFWSIFQPTKIPNIKQTKLKTSWFGRKNTSTQSNDFSLVRIIPLHQRGWHCPGSRQLDVVSSGFWVYQTWMGCQTLKKTWLPFYLSVEVWCFFLFCGASKSQNGEGWEDV